MLIHRYLAALTAFVFLLLAACRWQGAKETPEQLGAFPAEQFVERAARLAEKLNPQTRGIGLSLSAQSGYNRHGTIINACMVSGIDTTSASKLMVIFDTDTGELLRLIWSTPSRPSDAQQIRRPNQAVESAYYWLVTLGSEAERPSRIVTGGVKKVGGTWYVRWRSGSSEGVVGVDTHTGSLRLLSRRPHPAGSNLSVTSAL